MAVNVLFSSSYSLSRSPFNDIEASQKIFRWQRRANAVRLAPGEIIKNHLRQGADADCDGQEEVVSQGPFTTEEGNEEGEDCGHSSLGDFCTGSLCQQCADEEETKARKLTMTATKKKSQVKSPASSRRMKTKGIK
jgi:hypothetical protein